MAENKDIKKLELSDEQLDAIRGGFATAYGEADAQEVIDWFMSGELMPILMANACFTYPDKEGINQTAVNNFVKECNERGIVIPDKIKKAMKIQ